MVSYSEATGKKSLTNAHVVADHTVVLIRKHGSRKNYTAKIQDSVHECDLAILVVESEEFWKGMNSHLVTFHFCKKQSLLVFGYPQGDNADAYII